MFLPGMPPHSQPLGEEKGALTPLTAPFSPFPGRTELMLMATRELLRIPQGALAKPISIPSNLISLFSRYVDQQKLNLLETKLQ